MGKFDVCVIGAGPAGYAAAMRAYDFGKKICIVERGKLGGAGVHNGALSSKTLWELSRDYRRVLHQDRGYLAPNVTIDYNAVTESVERACAERVDRMRYQLDALAHPRDGNPGCISLVEGSASFIDPQRLVVERPDHCGEQIIRAEHFVIATGSRPRTLPNIEVDGERIMTSDHIMALDSFPKSLVILGAGVVGCEFATIFANFGQTRVYLIDRAERILPFEDEDIAEVCTRNLEAKGVTVHHSAQLQSMTVEGDEVVYTIRTASGRLETVHVERALISVGRVPNTDQLDLDKAGVALSARGHIENNDSRSTTAPHIFGAGDVTFDMTLVNVGEIEGRHAVEHMYGEVKAPLSYENLSTIMFLDPEIAAVGLNEQQARELRLNYRVGVYCYSMVSRAIAMRATSGYVKVLTTDDGDMQLLGMRALGVHASTTIAAISYMVSKQASIRELAEQLQPHPAITEAVQECARMMLGHSIYKSNVFPTQLRMTSHRFDPVVER